MLGAIAGDIIGSIYEGRGRDLNSKSFPLFQSRSRFTDDTVLTVAIADALLNHQHYVTKLKEYFNRYPDAGYGMNFRRWADSNETEPYYSFGNGSAMRVSPVAYAFNDLESVEKQAYESAAVTHNHPEGIKGAQSIAAAIWLARKGYKKDSIKDYMQQQFNYNLQPTVNTLRQVYSCNSSCQGSVPPAIICFLESSSFEDAIRNAISVGGDSDTIACMSGSIAEAFYQGIPEQIIQEVNQRLDRHLKAIIDQFQAQYPSDF